MKFIHLFSGFVCLMIVSVSGAQSELTSWVGAETKYDFNKKWNAGFEVQTRTDLRSGELNDLLLSPSLAWRPKRYVETGISYRWTSIPYSNETTNRAAKHRVTADITLRKLEELFTANKSRLGVSLRLRGTSEYQAEERVENTVRLKFKLNYNLPKTKLDLFASTELFYRFQRDVIYTFEEVQTVSSINKYRVKAGAKYPLGDRHALKLFGMHQWRYPDRLAEFVLGLGYSYQIN